MSLDRVLITRGRLITIEARHRRLAAYLIPVLLVAIATPVYAIVLAGGWAWRLWIATVSYTLRPYLYGW